MYSIAVGDRNYLNSVWTKTIRFIAEVSFRTEYGVRNLILRKYLTCRFLPANWQLAST